MAATVQLWLTSLDKQRRAEAQQGAARPGVHLVMTSCAQSRTCAHPHCFLFLWELRLPLPLRGKRHFYITAAQQRQEDVPWRPLLVRMLPAAPGDACGGSGRLC